MSTLPDIPDSIVLTAAAEVRCNWRPADDRHPSGRLCAKEGHCLDAARAQLATVWPHLYAAALNHAAELLDFEDNYTDTALLGLDYPLRELRRWADEATRP